MVVNVLNEAVGATLQGLQRMNKFALWRVHRDLHRRRRCGRSAAR